MFWRRENGRKGERGEPLPDLHDGAPDSERPSGLCPRCDKQSSFELIGFLPLTFDGGWTVAARGEHSPTYHERASVIICRHCRQGVAVLEEEWIGDARRVEGRAGGVISWRGFHWWPLAGEGLHQAVPAAIASAFKEAAHALSANCPRASAVMARRTLEAIAADKGETQGSLDQRLRNLSAKGLLHPSLVDWTKEVRLVGNSGAHFDPIGNVSIADARQLIDFVRELAKFLYVLPFELEQRRQVPAPPPRRV